MDELTESARKRSGRTIQARLDRTDSSVRGKGLNCKGGAGIEADDLLWARNARPWRALVGHAQWKIIQPPSLEDGNERAWRDHASRALEDRSGCPLKEEEKRRMRGVKI